MGKIHTPRRVKLFVGVLSSIPEMFPEVEARLSALWGDVDLRSDLFAFDSTDYYNDTMGRPIQRQFLGFAQLVDASELARIKLKTNELEAEIARGYTQVERPVNLDPGYLEEAKIVLASTKNFYHRILLSGGIYAEVTLHFEGGEWRPFPWTFPDFRTGRYNSFFSSLRSIYRKQIKD